MTDEARSFPTGNGPSGAQSPSNGSPGGDEYGARLRTIFENDETSRREKIVAALRLGAERFGVENAHLVRIDPAEGTHTIVETVGDHPEITKGSDTALSRTYCRETIARQRPLTITDAGAEGWSTDPAFQRLGFSTYLGAKVLVDGTLYGTVCFADEAASDELTAVETAFLERLADDIGRAIARSPDGDAPETAPPATARKGLLERIQEVAEIGAWVYDADTDTVTGTSELYRLLGLSEGDTFDLETGLSF